MQHLKSAIKYQLAALTIVAAALCPSMTFAADQSDGLERPVRIGVDERWSVYSDDGGQTDELSEARWWQRFDDALLDTLIEAGLRNNPDVLMATRRIAMARAAWGAAKANYFPQLQLGLGYTRSQQSGRLYGSHGDATRVGYFSGTVSMNWEVDVFGKITAQAQAKKRQVKVSRAERAGVKVSLEAEIASNYVQLRVNQTELQVANEHSASQLVALNIAKARHEAGLASGLDVDQALQVYYSTIASIPVLESNIHCGINAIAVLIGENPLTMHERLSQPQPIPGYRQIVAAGVPADLLRRRPDVVQAEEQIGVCASQLGIAKKDWLPTLTLQGSVGTEAHKIGDLFGSQSFTYSIAPTLSWTIFDGMARRYNIVEAQQSMYSAIDNYNLTVLTAVQEADNALATYYSMLKYIDRLDQLVAASANYDTTSLKAYKTGLTPYINVAQAQMSYLEDVNTLITAKGKALSALIDLYKALGGGWSDTMLRQD